MCCVCELVMVYVCARNTCEIFMGCLKENDKPPLISGGREYEHGDLEDKGELEMPHWREANNSEWN